MHKNFTGLCSDSLAFCSFIAKENAPFSLVTDCIKILQIYAPQRLIILFITHNELYYQSFFHFIMNPVQVFLTAYGLTVDKILHNLRIISPFQYNIRIFHRYWS